MKKTLSILSLIAVFSMSVPAMAAPPPPGGHGGPGRGPAMHGPGGRPPMVAPAPPRHRHHTGIAIGIGARHNYWSYPCYDYRVGFYDGFYPIGCPRLCPPPPPRAHWGTGVFINF